MFAVAGNVADHVRVCKPHALKSQRFQTYATPLLANQMPLWAAAAVTSRSREVQIAMSQKACQPKMGLVSFTPIINIAVIFLRLLLQLLLSLSLGSFTFIVDPFCKYWCCCAALSDLELLRV